MQTNKATLTRTGNEFNTKLTALACTNSRRLTSSAAAAAAAVVLDALELDLSGAFSSDNSEDLFSDVRSDSGAAAALLVEATGGAVGVGSSSGMSTTSGDDVDDADPFDRRLALGLGLCRASMRVSASKEFIPPACPECAECAASCVAVRLGSELGV